MQLSNSQVSSLPNFRLLTDQLFSIRYCSNPYTAPGGTAKTERKQDQKARKKIHFMKQTHFVFANESVQTSPGSATLILLPSVKSPYWARVLLAAKLSLPLSPQVLASSTAALEDTIPFTSSFGTRINQTQ